ncbi:hypothetical protein ACFX2A_008784 [Malus domestica]
MKNIYRVRAVNRGGMAVASLPNRSARSRAATSSQSPSHFQSLTPVTRDLAPKGKSCANYAQCVNQLLQSLSSTQLWLRPPLVKSDSETMDVNTDTSDDSWEIWNSFRLLCEHHSHLSVALDDL